MAEPAEGPASDVSSLAAALLETEAGEDPVEAANAVASVFGRVQELADRKYDLKQLFQQLEADMIALDVPHE